MGQHRGGCDGLQDSVPVPDQMLQRDPACTAYTLRLSPPSCASACVPTQSPLHPVFSLSSWTSLCTPRTHSFTSREGACPFQMDDHPATGRSVHGTTPLSVRLHTKDKVHSSANAGTKALHDSHGEITFNLPEGSSGRGHRPQRN